MSIDSEGPEKRLSSHIEHLQIMTAPIRSPSSLDLSIPLLSLVERELSGWGHTIVLLVHSFVLNTRLAIILIVFVMVTLRLACFIKLVFLQLK